MRGMVRASTSRLSGNLLLRSRVIVVEQVLTKN